MKWLATLLFLSMGASLFAQGFQSLGVSIGSGARALGMGGAFVAVADDATASSWNPAGLCVLIKPEASLSWKIRNAARVAVSASTTRTGDPSSGQFATLRTSDSSSTSSGSAFDFASVTYPLTLGQWRLVPQFSYQRVIDFRSRQKTDGPIIHINHEINPDGQSNLTQTEQIEFRSDDGVDVWATSVGISFHPKIYFGIALNWWKNHASTEDSRLEETMFCSQDECIPSSGEFHTTSDQTFDGFNINAGTLWKASPHWNFAAVFKSPFSMNHRFHFESTTRTAFPDLAYAQNEIYKESGSIQWPRTIALGVAYAPNDLWTLSLDQTWSNWSNATYEFRYQYNSMDNFETIEDAGTHNVIWPTNFDPASGENVTNQEQLNTYQTRFGLEYIIIRRLIFPLRFGLYQDRQYLKDGASKPLKNVGITFGAGITHNNYSFDVAVVHEQSDVTGCDYSFEPPEGGGTVMCHSDQPDTFRANRVYLSTIYRF